jgi:hypothetical protein
MRLWSIHPKYLDAAGFVALWREALLARKVLIGGTKGYKNHPQLKRFRKASKPVAAIDAYIQGVFKESLLRAYKFNPSKIGNFTFEEKIPVTTGQLECEWKHLLTKLEKRSPEVFKKCSAIVTTEPHPIFEIVSGGIEDWEKI